MTQTNKNIQNWLKQNLKKNKKELISRKNKKIIKET